MKYTLLSDNVNGQSIAVVEYISNKQDMIKVIRKAMEEHYCDELEIVRLTLPKDGNDGVVIYESSFEEGNEFEVRLEQIELYTIKDL